ncbi:MAG: phage shock protein E [Bacteroidia bacterium]|jgi:phage shock protein E
MCCFPCGMFGFLKRLFGAGVDLSQKISEGAVIIDVRSAGEYKSGHVQGSKNIPLNNIPAKADSIKAWNKPVITCCASGMRSETAASILRNKGVDANNGGPWQKVDRLIV